MKLKLLYSLGWNSKFRLEEVELAQSGKWIDLGNYKPRIESIDWGAPDPALIEEAKAINRLMDDLTARRKALSAKLDATHAALLERAAKEPMSPKPVIVPFKGKFRV